MKNQLTKELTEASGQITNQQDVDPENFNEVKTGSHSKAEPNKKKTSLISQQINRIPSEYDPKQLNLNLDQLKRGVPTPSTQ